MGGAKAQRSSIQKKHTKNNIKRKGLRTSKHLLSAPLMKTILRKENFLTRLFDRLHSAISNFHTLIALCKVYLEQSQNPQRHFSSSKYEIGYLGWFCKRVEMFPNASRNKEICFAGKSK